MNLTIVVLLLMNQLTPTEAAPTDTAPVRIGLALSGGAALGLAHIGVLKVLEREGISVCCISGNSMGSMIGGVYSAGYTATEIESIALHVDWRHLFSSSIPFGAQYLPERQQSQRYILQLRHKNFVPSLPSGLIPLQNVEFLLMDLLSKIEYNTSYDFDNLHIPFRTVAVDLITGKKIVFKQGRLEQTIRASIAIPGVFSPESIDSMLLVDGGVQQYLPVDPLFELNPDFIIAVITMKKNEETGISLIDIISRSMDLTSVEDLTKQKKYAAVLIEPNVDPFSHSDYPRARELIGVGEAAAEAALPGIWAKLAGHKIATPGKIVTVRPVPIVRCLRIEGLHVTRESMVHNAIRTQPGMILYFDYLIEDLTALFNTGLFENINYRLEAESNDSVDLVIELKERDYGFYALGIHYDNVNNVLLGLEVGQGNLGGSGASIRAAINLGDPNECRLGLTGTRLFSLPFGYRIDGFWSSIDRSYYQELTWLGDYNVDQRGVVAEAGYILGHDAFFNIGINAYNAAYRLPPLSVFDSIPAREWTIGPTFNLEVNNLDNLYLPTKGLVYRLKIVSSSKTLNATNEFLKIEYSSEEFVPLSSRFLIHSGIDLGATFGKLSWSDYFHTGGDNFVGFHYEEFTTENRAILRLGIDFKLFQIFNQRDYPLYLQLFSNLAYFKRLDELFDVTNFSAEDLHLGVGAGIRTNTPIGVLQLALGIGDFYKEPFKKNIRYTLFVSVGRDFRYTR